LVGQEDKHNVRYVRDRADEHIFLAHIAVSSSSSLALAVTVGSVALAPVDQEGGIVEKFIRRENVTLYKKRLAEPHTDAEHKILLKLLADEEARDASVSRGA
jgi:hypothetical protein